MTSDEQDDRERSDPPTDPTGSSTPGYGQQYGSQQSGYGPQAQYGSPPQYGQHYGSQPPYGQQYGGYAPPPAPYGPYGYPAASGGYGQYGESAVPAKPGAVTIAAVLGFILAALGVLTTLFLIFVGAVSAGGAASGELEDAIPDLGSAVAAFAGVFIVLGVLALAWTVLMILGCVRALGGRSRVPLLVGGSIAIATTALFFLLVVGSQGSNGGGLVFVLALFAASIAVVVLLCTRASAAFFEVHRARRGVR